MIQHEKSIVNQLQGVKWGFFVCKLGLQFFISMFDIGGLRAWFENVLCKFT